MSEKQLAGPRLRSAFLMTCALVLFGLALLALAQVLASPSAPLAPAMIVAAALLAIAGVWFLMYFTLVDRKVDALLAFPEAVETAASKSQDLRREYNRMITATEGLAQAVDGEAKRLVDLVQAPQPLKAEVERLEARLAEELSSRKQLEQALQQWQQRLVEVVRGLERLRSMPDVRQEYVEAADRLLADIEALYEPLQFTIVRPKAGDRFDDLIHEVAGEIEDLAVAPGTIVRTEAWGFVFGDTRQRARVVLAAETAA